MFWIVILISAAFTWISIKRGLYETWAFAFNAVISIYLAFALGPRIKDFIPAASDMPYGDLVPVAATAAGAFLILHGISYIFLTSLFNVSFPKVLDTLGAGLLGFLTMFLVLNFTSFLICITPIFRDTPVEKIGFNSQLQQTNVAYLSWWCDLANTIVSSKDGKYTTENAVNKLLKSMQPPVPIIVKPVAPIKPKRNLEIENLGPPPDVDANNLSNKPFTPPPITQETP